MGEEDLVACSANLAWLWCLLRNCQNKKRCPKLLSSCNFKWFFYLMFLTFLMLWCRQDLEWLRCLLCSWNIFFHFVSKYFRYRLGKTSLWKRCWNWVRNLFRPCHFHPVIPVWIVGPHQLILFLNCDGSCSEHFEIFFCVPCLSSVTMYYLFSESVR